MFVFMIAAFVSTRFTHLCTDTANIFCSIASQTHQLSSGITNSSAFHILAENSNLSYKSFDSKAVGKLEIVEGKYIMSEVTLMPHVVVHKESDKERALRIINKSEALCLISNSVKSKILLNPTIEVED